MNTPELRIYGMYDAMARQVTDRLHVSASGRDVVRHARAAIARKSRYDRAHKRARKEFYRACLARHKENRALYAYVMRGGHGSCLT